MHGTRLAAILAAATVCAGACGQKADVEHAAVSAGHAESNAVPAGEGTTMKISEQRSGAWSPELTAAERATLFRIADDTLAWCVRGAGGAFSFNAYELTPKLKQPMATFVTLKIGENLRGCIGSLAPVAPLYKSVHDNAVNAALHDYRFRPVTPMELPKLNVHVSVLSPITDIPSIDRFTIGEHGIIIEKGMHRAVYLPEVAVEQKWTVDETLSSLSLKAGMESDAWRQGARFKVFSSVVLAREP